MKLACYGLSQRTDLVQHRTIQAFHFGAAGEPSLVPIQLQTIEGEGVLQLPVLSTVFDTPAPIELAVITFQRSEKTFTALFAVLPRRKGGSERRSARGGVLPTAHVLVCRSSGAFAGYTDCVEEERDLAIMAANL